MRGFRQRSFLMLVVAFVLCLAPIASAQTICTPSITPNLPSPGQLQPNFGNFVNVTVRTPSTCDQASVRYTPATGSGIIVDQSSQTTTKQPDGTYPDLVFTYRAGPSAAPGRYTLPIFATGPTLATSYGFTIDVAGTPGFSFDIVPGGNPNTATITAGTTQTFRITTFPEAGFTSPVRYVATNSAGYPMTNTDQTVNSPYPSISFTLSVPASAAAGSTFTVDLTATGGSTTLNHSILVTVAAPAVQPDFNIALSPNVVTITPGQPGIPVTFSVNPLNGFTGQVTIDVPTLPVPNVTVTENGVPVTSFVLTPGQTKTVIVAAGANAAPGTFTVSFPGNSPGLPEKRTTLTVTILAAPVQSFQLNVSPSSLTFNAGGQSAPITIGTTAINGFNSPVTVTVPTIPNVTFTDNGVAVTTFVLNPGQTKTLIAVSSNPTQSGTVTGQFRATSGTLAPVVSTVQLTLLAQDFSMAIAPPQLTVKSGTSANATVTITRINGFNGNVVLSATSTSPDVQVRFSPSDTLTGTETTRTLIVTVSPNITVGSSALVTVTASAPSLNNKQLSVAFPVTIDPVVPVVNRPILTSLTPDGVVAGGPPVEVILTGENFAAALTALLNDPNLVVESTSIIIPGTMARASVRAKPTARPGRYRLDLQNDPPNGARTAAGGLDFFVYDSGDIGAPLGVTGAAILSPLSGKCLFAGSELYAHGIVATSGTGTITGHWELENAGVYSTFSAFTLTVHAGEPTPVDTQVPVPATYAGMHRLRLVIDSPAVARSAEVPILMSSVQCASDLTILGPRPDEQAQAVGAESSANAAGDESDGTSPIVLRWSVVPGATGYVAEIEKDGRFFKRVGACSDEELRAGIPCEPYDNDRGEIELDLVSLTMRGTPDDNAVVDAAGMAALQGSTFRWRVTPRFPGETQGLQWSAWAPLPIPSQKGAGRKEKKARVAVMTHASVDAAVPLQLRRELASSFDAMSDMPASDLRSIAYEAMLSAPEPAAASSASLSSAKTAKKNPFRRDWLVLPGFTSTLTRHADPQEGTLQVSSQADLGAAPFALKYTTDLNGTNVYGSNFTARNSRNWVANLGNAQKSTLVVRPEAVIGYAPPSFFSESQYVTASFARGGALARAGSRFGTLSYYSTFDSLLSGVLPGNFSTQQKIEAAAFELPKLKKFTFKLLALQVNDLQSDYSAGARGRSFGFLTRYKVSPMFEIVGEAARGRFNSRDDRSLDRDGNAYRTSINGMKGTFTYRLALTRTDAGFINPANRGFTNGGIPNRTGGDLAITKGLAGGTLSVQLRRQNQSRPTSRTNATGVNASYNRRLGAVTTLTISGQRNSDHGTADKQSFLPATDRQQSGLSLALSQSIGRFSFSQSFAHQQLRDQIHKTARNNTDTLSMTASGAVTTNFNMSANLSVTNTAGLREVTGRNDSTVFSLQPSYAIPSLHIALQPRASWNLTRNNRYDTENQGEQYQGLIDWNPEWLNSVGSLQLSSNWNRDRNRMALRPAVRNTTRSYTGTFTLRWGAGIGPATFRRRADLPGQMPAMGAPNAAANPVNGHSASSNQPSAK